MAGPAIRSWPPLADASHLTARSYCRVRAQFTLYAQEPMQFADGLTDRQAADAVRRRIDWTYALALELTDAGFDASVLSEFRDRLLSGDPAQLLFERMLEVVRAHKLLKERGRARTDATPILAAIRTLNQLECVGETLRHALNTLATVAPACLAAAGRPRGDHPRVGAGLLLARTGSALSALRADRTRKAVSSRARSADGRAILGASSPR